MKPNEASASIDVLLVDDDQDDAFLLKRQLANLPNDQFRVEWLQNYHEAEIAIAERRHAIYMIDYRLGEHTGLDLLRFAKPEQRNEPFILLTGAGDEALEVRTMELAASDYIVKGVMDAETLGRTLRYALQRKTFEQQRVENLVALNKSKDEFISLASHQLRTPATGVKQYLGMLLEGFVGEMDDKQLAIIKKAYDSNERQLRIVSDLLKVAQVDSGNMMLHKTKAPLVDLIRDVIEEQRDTYASRGQSISLTCEIDALIAYDAGAIRMVVENIIDNASKYSENGKSVSVRLFEQETHVCISIRDNGVGIAIADEEKLFGKFSRISNPLSTVVGGTGLGLYWAKQVVTVHGGELNFERNKDGGSTFTVCLPK